MAGFVAAQNSTANLPVPSFVDINRKAQWCISQQNVCPDLCGGMKFVQQNKCDNREITEYQCICANGTAPANIHQYVGSVPNFICVATFEQCRRENPGSQNCPVCGTLKPDDVPEGVVSSSTSVSATATATATGTAVAADGASTASPTPNGAAAWTGHGSGMGGLAMGAVMALGLL